MNKSKTIGFWSGIIILLVLIVIPTPQGMKPDALRALGCLIDKGNIEPMYKKGEKIARSPDSRGLLPVPSLLRTARETFTSYSSSIDKACGHTRQLFSFPTRFEIVSPCRIVWVNIRSNLCVSDNPGPA